MALVNFQWNFSQAKQSCNILSLLGSQGLPCLYTCSLWAVAGKDGIAMMSTKASTSSRSSSLLPSCVGARERVLAVDNSFPGICQQHTYTWPVSNEIWVSLVEDHLSSLCWEEVSLACGQIPGEKVVPVHTYWTHHRLPTTLFNLGVSFLGVWECSPGICDWLPCPTNQVQKHSSYPERLSVCRDLFSSLGGCTVNNGWLISAIWAENLPNWFTIPINLMRSYTLGLFHVGNSRSFLWVHLMPSWSYMWPRLISKVTRNV